MNVNLAYPGIDPRILNNHHLGFTPQIEIEACEENDISIFDAGEEVFPGGIDLPNSIVKDEFYVRNKASAKTIALFPPLIKKARSMQIFNPVEKFAGSQTQLIKLCQKLKEYPDLFNEGILFLLVLDGLSGKKFFVADISRYTSSLVSLQRFEYDGLYYSNGRGPLIFVPIHQP